MNGKRYLLDTNAVIALLKGDSQLLRLLQSADWIGISVISQIEFFAFTRLTQADRKLFQRFVQRIDIINLSSEDISLLERIVEIRQKFRLKLPDAIIAAMAIQNLAILVTADQEFAKVDIIKVIKW